jgi:DNA gyrase/topoisomerase IV subunit A
MVIRQHAADIRVAGRNTQGVHLIRLKEGDSIAAVAAVVAEEEEKQLAEKEKNNINSNVLTPGKLSSEDKNELKQENVPTLKPDKIEKRKPVLPKKTTKTSGKKKKQIARGER